MKFQVIMKTKPVGGPALPKLLEQNKYKLFGQSTKVYVSVRNRTDERECAHNNAERERRYKSDLRGGGRSFSYSL